MINESIECLGYADYVGWLNADDLLSPGGSHRMATYLENQLQCGRVRRGLYR
jgi:hypothetical protein